MQNRFIIMGEFIRKKRVEKGLTQTQVSKALGYSSSQFISNIERGLASPPFKALKKLMGILDLDEREVMDVLLRQQEEYIREELFDGKKIEASL